MDIISLMISAWLIFALAVVIAELIVWTDEVFEKAREG